LSSFFTLYTKITENEFKIITLRKKQRIKFLDKFGERFLNRTSTAREIKEKNRYPGIHQN
jgi:hypothetical protein